MLMESTLTSASVGNTELTDHFLSAFRAKIALALERSGIRILSAQPMQYRLCVEFDESGHRAKVDFCYNDKKTWTCAQEVGGLGSSNGLLGRVKSLMEGKT